MEELCGIIKNEIRPLTLYGVSGGAAGADRLFEGWCFRFGVRHRSYPADWSKNRRAAGPIRNQEMIDQAWPDFYLAFAMEPDSGTQDCVERAKVAGILGYVDGPDVSRDRFRLESGQLIHHHRIDLCTPPCSIHDPSNHHMRTWPRSWRGDRGMIERQCRHGVGHPDPDDLAFKARMVGEDSLFFWEGIHGCDGCCSINYIEGQVA